MITEIIFLIHKIPFEEHDEYFRCFLLNVFILLVHLTDVRPPCFLLNLHCLFVISYIQFYIHLVFVYIFSFIIQFYFIFSFYIFSFCVYIFILFLYNQFQFVFIKSSFYPFNLIYLVLLCIQLQFLFLLVSASCYLILQDYTACEKQQGLTVNLLWFNSAELTEVHSVSFFCS